MSDTLIIYKLLVVQTRLILLPFLTLLHLSWYFFFDWPKIVLLVNNLYNDAGLLVCFDDKSAAFVRKAVLNTPDVR